MFYFFSDSSTVALSVLNGLLIWYHNLLPSLFPFMILSGFLIRASLEGVIMAIFRPLFGHLFPVNDSGIYCIITGFLCGFPMGAKNISELYLSGKLSKSEANYLLAFCNNIGPAFLIGVVLSRLNIFNIYRYLFVFYGVPFIYGIVLGKLYFPKHCILVSRKKQILYTLENKSNNMLNCFEDSLESAIKSIVILAGYVIVFQVIGTAFNLIIPSFTAPILVPILQGILEVTGGTNLLLNGSFSLNTICLFLFPLLTFGGISCFMQTSFMIKDTDLSMISYVKHKIIQTIFCIPVWMIMTKII